MRDRPAFHEVEPPPVVTGPIDGMTDEQWAARNERREAGYRRVFETLFTLSLLGSAIMTLPLWTIPGWLWLVLGIVWIANLGLFAGAIVLGYVQRPFR